MLDYYMLYKEERVMPSDTIIPRLQALQIIKDDSKLKFASI